jgi:hypothetical protein
MRTARLISQSVQAGGLVAFAPRRDRLTRDSVAFGYLTDGCAVVDLSYSAQSNLDSDARCNIRKLWVTHRETVAGISCPSTMSR